MMRDQNTGKKDLLEGVQYWIFRIVLFIIFLVMAYQFLDQHTHISKFFSYLGLI